MDGYLKGHIRSTNDNELPIFAQTYI